MGRRTDLPFHYTHPRRDKSLVKKSFQSQDAHDPYGRARVGGGARRAVANLRRKGSRSGGVRWEGGQEACDILGGPGLGMVSHLCLP